MEARRNIQEKVTIGKVPHSMDLGVKKNLEIYEYPGGYAKRFDAVAPGGGAPSSNPLVTKEGERVARLRMELEAVRGVRIEGASNAGHLMPGYRFELVDNEVRHKEDVGKYVVTAVEHNAHLSAYRSGEKDAFTYENRLVHSGRAAVPSGAKNAATGDSWATDGRRRRGSRGRRLHRPLRSREGAVSLGPRGRLRYQQLVLGAGFAGVGGESLGRLLLAAARARSRGGV